MNIRTVPGALFGENCYVLWPEGGSDALVVDPGPGTAVPVRALLDREGLSLVGVLLTHGHVDHVWDAEELAGAEIPVFLPAADNEFMSDPVGALGLAPSSLALGQWRRPKKLVLLGSEVLQVAGLTLRAVPAPGHSPGSSIFLVATPPTEGPVALSGDVIFAGSVGRTDLPGGDEWVMRETLRTLADVLDPATMLLPGHGARTVWRDELSTNPFVLRARRRTQQ